MQKCKSFKIQQNFSCCKKQQQILNVFSTVECEPDGGSGYAVSSTDQARRIFVFSMYVKEQIVEKIIFCLKLFFLDFQCLPFHVLIYLLSFHHYTQLFRHTVSYF